MGGTAASKLVVKIARPLLAASVGAAAVILLRMKTGWSAWCLAALAAFGLAAVSVCLARRQGGLLGPHFFYDLVRLARRSRTRDLRILYLLVLLMGLGLVYWMQFPREGLVSLLLHSGQSMKRNDMSNFAQVFVFTVILVQNFTVLLLTPVYVGSAIAEEKERKTLDLLFTTQMKDREIILGKLCSRLAHLGFILLAGLPVLSLAQLWGGIDFPILLANFANTGLILLSVGSVSILVSSLCRKVVTAVMTVYAFVLPVTLCLGVFSIGGSTSVLGIAQSDVGGNPEVLAIVLGGLATFHGIVSVISVGVALAVMRGQHGGEDYAAPRRPVGRPLPPPRPKPLARDDVAMIRQLSLRVDRPYELPPVHDDPLFWKEMNVGMNRTVMRPLFYTLLGLSLSMLLLSFCVSLGGGVWTERSHDLGVTLKVLCVGWSLVCCLTVGYVASSTIARERQQGTIEGLLTLPTSRIEILSRKWLGCFFRGWLWWVCLTAEVVLSTLLTGIHIAGGMLFLAAVFIHGAFFCSVGLFLSVVSKSVLTAHGKMALLVLFLFFGTWIFSEVIAVSLAEHYGEFLRVGLNPVRTWWALGFSWRDFWDRNSTLDRRVAGALLGLAFYGMLAIGFWLLACWRFSRERNWRVE